MWKRRMTNKNYEHHFNKYDKERCRLIKIKKLGYFTEKYLRHKGKMDYKNKIVRQENNQYIAPIFNKEINLALIAVQREKERFFNIEADIKSKIGAMEIALENKNEQIKNVSEQKEELGENWEKIRFNGEQKEVLDDDVLQLYRKNEEKIHIISKAARLQNLNSDIMNVETKKQRYEILLEKEKEITELRCQQYYELLIARLNAYWEGVLYENASTEDISPLFCIDDLLIELKSNLHI